MSEAPGPADTAELAPVCVLAGGLGTRLGERSGGLPKAAVPVAGAPFIVHPLALLSAHGARRVVLCVGHGAEHVQAAVGDGAALGLEVSYSHDAPGLDGTAGAVRRALPLLGERFLVMYGDTYLRIDYRAVDRAHRASGCPALMCVLRNEGRWDASNAEYADGRVRAYDKRAPTAAMRWIDYGLGVLEARALVETAPEADDLAAVYSELARTGRLAGYEATERFYEIGSPASLEEADAFLRTASPLHRGDGPRRASTVVRPA